MTALRNTLLQRWNAYSSSEKWVWGGLAVGALLVVLWLYVWEPLQDRRVEAQAQLQAAQESLEWLQRAAPRVRAAQEMRVDAPGNVQSMTNLVSRAASEHGLALSRFEQAGSDGLRFWLDDQPFEQVLMWTADLEGQGVAMDQVTISRTNTSGLVNVRGVVVRQ